jgi:tripartite-type tricarboxylate transporter receptor subunit TctC
MPIVRRLLALLALILSGIASPALAQEAWPNRAIRIVVPTAPGVAPDVFARIYAAELAKLYKVPVTVENKPGAAAILAIDNVLKAPADGYTILYAFNAPFTMNPHLYSKLPYDAQRDLVPLTQTLTGAYFIVTAPNSPLKSIKDLIDSARANPEKISYASYGVGSAAHLALALLEEKAGIRALHVPYKLSALPDVISGVVGLSTEPNGSVIPLIQRGQVRALAYLGSQRHPLLPNVPTVAETVPGFEVLGWHGLWLKAGSPKPEADRLYADIARITRSPEMTKRMADVGFEPSAASPSDTAAIIRRESAEWGTLIRARGIKAD